MSTFAPLERVEVCHAVAPQDRILVRGGDALDFLHRISASATGGPEPRHLVLTDDKGALIDAPLACPYEDGFRLVAGPGRGPDLAAWLEKWIIVEDVRVQPDPQEAWRLGEPDLVAGDVVRPRTHAGPPVLLGGVAPSRVDLPEWEAANFRAGRLYAGPATASGPNPLELGWKDLVAFDKGCYIGQEVIARMDTYDKVRRGLSMAALVAPLAAGTALSVDGKKAGSVLASVVLDEGVFAWVVVDKSLEPGARLQAGNEAGGTLLRMSGPAQG
jgi:folate-binding protein YgfZ